MTSWTDGKTEVGSLCLRIPRCFEAAASLFQTVIRREHQTKSIPWISFPFLVERGEVGKKSTSRKQERALIPAGREPESVPIQFPTTFISIKLISYRCSYSWSRFNLFIWISMSRILLASEPFTYFRHKSTSERCQPRGFMRHGKIFDCPNKFCAALFHGGSREIYVSSLFCRTPLGLFSFTSLLLPPFFGKFPSYSGGRVLEIFVPKNHL
ncbi:hypothetical protein CEXT_416551 [Caerostris extrusa]|uniref:Uncharacterized protein n=1 Tax=Caerostris extrusa TaxID=172846 RepID=A0AAV4XZL1_CAEEX|nr:hypothetical protein CEXT_416551 [Caerostris extrusa]